MALICEYSCHAMLRIPLVSLLEFQFVESIGMSVDQKPTRCFYWGETISDDRILSRAEYRRYILFRNASYWTQVFPRNCCIVKAIRLLGRRGKSHNASARRMFNSKSRTKPLRGGDEWAIVSEKREHFGVVQVLLFIPSC